jgi:hypothetical protein
MSSSTKSTESNLWMERFKLVTASLVVGALLVVVGVGIVNKYCILQLHPAINFLLLFGAIVLLAYVEALHYGVVAIEKWDMDKYALEYPRACKMHKLVDTPVKVKKFLVGRQFFVVSSVHAGNTCTAPNPIPPYPVLPCPALLQHHLTMPHCLCAYCRSLL